MDINQEWVKVYQKNEYRRVDEKHSLIVLDSSKIWYPDQGSRNGLSIGDIVDFTLIEKIGKTRCQIIQHFYWRQKNQDNCKLLPQFSYQDKVPIVVLNPLSGVWGSGNFCAGYLRHVIYFPFDFVKKVDAEV